MSRQQRISRHVLSFLVARPRPACLPALRHSSTTKPNPTTTTPGAPAALPSSVLRNIKPDTRRKADLNPSLKTATTTTTTSDAAAAVAAGPSTTTHPERNLRASPKRDPVTDREIIRLFKEGVPWRTIDETLGRPHSYSYRRYYGYLDPEIYKAWNLKDGRVDENMLKRLAYLVEVEKQSFSDIETRYLMNRPWQTPTPYASPEVLKAASNAGIKAPSMPSNRFMKQRQANDYKFNKVSLHQKYMDYKNSLAENRNRLNMELSDRAILRSVELYGQNWKKVAQHADLLLDQWTLTKAATNNTLDPSSKNMEFKDLIPEREPLNPNRAAKIYQKVERKGVRWGLQDDAVMTRKILELGQTRPDILDVLDRPWRESTDDPNQQQQLKYWQEISIALGNHSPIHCKRRWDGLRNLQDEDKSSQSKSWHRLERFQYWMLWHHYYQQRRLQSPDLSRPDKDPLNTIKGLQDVCEELAFGKDIAKWLRHRTREQCEKLFTGFVNDILDLGIAPHQVLQLRQERRLKQKQLRKEMMEQSGETQPLPKMELEPRVIFDSRTSLLNSIFDKVAVPELLHMSTAKQVTAEGAETTTTTSPNLDGQSDSSTLVRPDWTLDRIRVLCEIVMQAKQGVQRGDFELDWSRIADQLKRKLDVREENASSSSSSSLPPSSILSPTGDSLNLSEQQLYQQHHSNISSIQCKNCWEYIISPGAAASSSGMSLLPGPSSSSSNSDGDAQSSSRADHDGDQLGDWSDYELLLLQKGVRKFGNEWVTIRAQFLPKRNVSELQQAWMIIRTPAGSSEDQEKQDQAAEGPDGAAATTRLQRGHINRLSDADYSTLLSALDKVGDVMPTPATRVNESK
ncbi:hypothetical protein B0O80DRAFT_465869 [Mortierella sp. GBAus27b]|nr:hypothetical protein BGX31_007475 [Mortierella sp. GBA43]KAI8347250.1 hypothetical protein B0O80DRAFT_465869 [Mortierella sp. GBAus27b]